ncbi:hypothetical protein [Dielma fastidiosa]|uniref:hypothetical protein n=1 Tax=Dielma fastidiosa TaxID=1034346 RepID=UPI000E477763|nr:hypothetical protein [Dielma fastidiosa]RHN01513.1 hypothetical protein DWZ33_05840 [Dielma fastidiosa]
MLNKTRIITLLNRLKENNVELTVKLLANELNITEDEAFNEIELLIKENFVNSQPTGYTPSSNGKLIELGHSYSITSKCEDYLISNRTTQFLKWYPIVVSTIALIVSILVAIYK